MSSLKSWGLNNFSQLGHSGEENCFNPREISFFNDKGIKYASGGDVHSVVVTDKNEVYVWGKNDENQLGFRDTKYIPTQPELQKFFSSEENKIEKVICSNNFCYGINYTSQKIFSWGFGENYVLANLEESQNEEEPFEVNTKEFFKGMNVEQIALGSQHVMVSLRPHSAAGENSNITRLENFDYNLRPFLNKKQMKKMGLAAEELEIKKVKAPSPSPKPKAVKKSKK